MRSARAIGAAAGAALLLGGCGGGVWIGLGGSDDEPPQVSLVADASHAAPGQTLRLAAAASDDFEVVRVEFWRLDPDGTSVRLGSDGSAPYEWTTTVPTGASGTLRFVARAVDDVGQASDSDAVDVAVP